MPQLTSDSKAATVGLHYGFADGEPHACPVDLHALISSAVKFFEDERLFEIVDAWTAIGNADVECLVLGFHGDADRSTGGVVICCRLQEVHPGFLGLTRNPP